LSRDPIGEVADHNLFRYAFDAPTNASDPSGLDTKECGCCNGDTIKTGRDALERQYDNAKTEATGFYNPKIEGGVDKLECIDRTYAILQFIGQVPKCWLCVPEHRQHPPDAAEFISDHWVVVCRSFDKKCTVKDEIVFDWYHQNADSVPYEKFKEKYPLESPWPRDLRLKFQKVQPLHLRCDGVPKTPFIGNHPQNLRLGSSEFMWNEDREKQN
jgi:hypothetical protein